MAPRLSPIVVQRIEDALLDPGVTINHEYIKTIARTYLKPPTGGQIRVVTPDMDAAMMLVLDQFPWFYQDELKEFLFEAFDIDICLSTVRNALHRIKYTRKKIRVEVAQRNERLRSIWLNSLQTFAADQLIFVDESGSDERTGDRLYGYAKSGTKAVVSRWLSHRERVSVLPAYTVDGYIASTTFVGTCNGDIFEDFIIEQLLPLCNPYPQPRSVIVMDNASIHHSNRDHIEAAYHRKGVWIRYLPPCSPDFNPIEESFNDLKAFIRRYYRKYRGSFRDYQGFLEWAIRKTGTGSRASSRAKAQFIHSGIRGI
ncbi:transposase [Sclerotinia borealis F-4128]|uniref:Transposase n=1 Tax=Sclerotinia borealis (strain F-4128) TaxID=1432307 RepID=W9BZ94_SCLBF|nr:transposase [Sclerotinia borealis F-4128]